MPTKDAFHLQIPTYTAEELEGSPWIPDIELKIWSTLATAIEAPTFNAAALAEELRKLFPSNRSPGVGPEPRESSHSYLYEFWGIYAKAAGQVPVNHPGQQRLVELLIALRHLRPDPAPAPHREALFGDPMMWYDLPILWPAFRIAVDVDTGINLQAFMARISAAGLARFWFLGITSLNKALEMKLDPRSSAYEKRGQLLDEAVPAAVVWIRLAGAEIYAMSLEEEPMWDMAEGQGGSWMGRPDRFSEKRWDFWKQKFTQISTDTIVTQETRDLAQEAKCIMDGFDSNLAPARSSETLYYGSFPY